MDKRENVHSGHRNRMFEKLKAGYSLLDHELLEMLLFSYLPRKNTNGIAHLLIKEFGNLENVFNASLDDLVKVDGIGATTAKGIVVAGEVIKRLVERKTKEKTFSKTLSYGAIEGELIDYFKGKTEEKFILLLYDKNYKKISHLEYVDNKKDSVSGDIPEIAKAFALHKPTFAIIAHNHPSGNLKPSMFDDFSTGKINLLCTSHGVTLLDHIIVAGDKTWSYHAEHRMDKIKKAYNIEEIYFTIKE